jgi:hypothetical protein
MNYEPYPNYPSVLQAAMNIIIGVALTAAAAWLVFAQ